MVKKDVPCRGRSGLDSSLADRLLLLTFPSWKVLTPLNLQYSRPLTWTHRETVPVFGWMSRRLATCCPLLAESRHPGREAKGGFVLVSTGLLRCINIMCWT